MKTRAGLRAFVFTITLDGDSFTATNVGAAGSLDIEDGEIDGDKLTWTMTITRPVRSSCGAQRRFKVVR